MVRGIHYFSAEVKPKLMSSQGAALRSQNKITDFFMILAWASPFKATICDTLKLPTFYQHSVIKWMFYKL